MIYLDLHGVLSNFVRHACDWHQEDYNLETFTDYNFYESWDMYPNEFWDNLKPQVFWEHIPKYDYAHHFYQELLELDQVRICTAPAPCDKAYLGTINWLRRELGVSPLDVIFIAEKYLLANKNSILIDDCDGQANRFYSEGGKSFIIDRPWNSGTYTWQTCLENIKTLYIK